MNDIYLAGFGLVSSLGADLEQAMHQLQLPVVPQTRTLNGLEHAIPYHAIALSNDEPQHQLSVQATPQPSDWYRRCEKLMRQVTAEAGVVNRTGALYIASASLNAGALELSDTMPVPLPQLLSELAAMIDWQGPVYWISTACTSSLTAILAAKQAMVSGSIDEALIIGLELENQLTLAGFAGMQLLSDHSGKPFAADRNGLALGEAVAALRLSRQPNRWRIAGGAQVIDSSQASGASVPAYQSMLTQTLSEARWSAAQIDLIKVQAAGSVINDAVEANALRGFFADGSPLPPLLSLKPLIGHTLGASGAAEIALMVAMLEHQQWSAYTIEADAELGVTLAAKLPLQQRYILACIMGFGGSHSAIALEQMSA